MRATVQAATLVARTVELFADPLPVACLIGAGRSMAGRLGSLPSFVSAWLIMLSFFGSMASVNSAAAQARLLRRASRCCAQQRAAAAIDIKV